jgi:hypothetical protein
MSTSNIRDGYTAIDVSNTEIVITNTYSYYACKTYIYGIVLNTSVTLRVCIAYLKNGAIDTMNSNDGNYSYMNRFVKLEGADYTKWGQDDTYITSYVEKNISDIIRSTYIPNLNELPYVDTYL